MIEVEVLSVDRRSKCADCLTGSTPEARDKIYCERKRNHTEHDARNRHCVCVALVARELELADKVEAEHAEDDDPESEEHFAVEQSPTVSEVGYREELEGESQLNESEHDLDGVHPAA